MGKQIESLRHEEATAAGLKIAQMIEALNEVQGTLGHTLFKYFIC